MLIFACRSMDFQPSWGIYFFNPWDYNFYGIFFLKWNHSGWEVENFQLQNKDNPDIHNWTLYFSSLKKLDRNFLHFRLENKDNARFIAEISTKIGCKIYYLW